MVACRDLSPSVCAQVIRVIRLEFPNFTPEKRLEAVNSTGGADKTTEITREIDVLWLAQLELTSERILHKIESGSSEITFINEAHFMSQAVVAQPTLDKLLRYDKAAHKALESAYSKLTEL
jgi:hypothetical protein